MKGNRAPTANRDIDLQPKSSLLDPARPERFDVPAVGRAMAILECLGENPAGLTVRDLMRLRIPESSIVRILKSLVQAGYVHYSRSTGRYHLGIKLFALGYAVPRSLPLLKLANPALSQLSAASGETAELWVPDGLALVLASTAQVSGSFQIPRQASVGVRDLRNHSKAPGKMYLALMPESFLESYVKHVGLQRWGPRTITELGALKEELERIRRRGYAVDHEENRRGVCRIAAPVYGPEGEAQGFISIMGPAFRLTEEKDAWFAHLVMTYAEEITRELQ